MYSVIHKSSCILTHIFSFHIICGFIIATSMCSIALYLCDAVNYRECFIKLIILPSVNSKINVSITNMLPNNQLKRISYPLTWVDIGLIAHIIKHQSSRFFFFLARYRLFNLRTYFRQIIIIFQMCSVRLICRLLSCQAVYNIKDNLVIRMQSCFLTLEV